MCTVICLQLLSDFKNASNAVLGSLNDCYVQSSWSSHQALTRMFTFVYLPTVIVLWNEGAFFHCKTVIIKVANTVAGMFLQIKILLPYS